MQDCSKHNAIHAPIAAAAAAAIKIGVTSSGGGATMGGALSGIPRSAAKSGVGTALKVNRPASPAAIRRRRMTQVPLLLDRIVSRPQRAVKLTPSSSHGICVRCDFWATKCHRAVNGAARRPRPQELVQSAGPGTRPGLRSLIPRRSGRATRVATTVPRSPSLAPGI